MREVHISSEGTSRWRHRSESLISPLLLLLAGVVLALSSACGSGGDGPSLAPSTTPLAPIEQLIAAYHDPDVDPSAKAWEDLLADEGFDAKPVAVVEFVRMRPEADAAAGYEAYLEALAPAVVRVSGEMVSINDTLMPGLEGLEGYDGGASWVATFPSLRAYVDAMLDERVVAAAAKRRAAIAEAQVLLGANLVPDLIKQLPPNEPAFSFPSGRVSGKSGAQIVADLLSIYPSGGADPTKSALESMVAFPGFADQRVNFINLYRFNSAPGGGTTALGEYNAAALPVVLAHGGRPKVLVNVSHHLVGPVGWDRFIFVSWPSLAVFTDLRLDPVYVEAQKERVMSAEQYGNLITIARGDRRPQ